MAGAWLAACGPRKLARVPQSPLSGGGWRGRPAGKLPARAFAAAGAPDALLTPTQAGQLLPGRDGPRLV